jgi:DNA polymerase III alpha subunit
VASAATVIEQARKSSPSSPAARLERERRLRRIQNELRYLRMHVTDHPMRVLRPDAERLGCVPTDRLSQRAGENVAFAGLVAATRRVPLAESAATQYLTLEDERGLIEARLSPEAFARFARAITTPGPYLVQARVVEQRGHAYLDVESLIPFYQRPAAGRCALPEQAT